MNQTFDSVGALGAKPLSGCQFPGSMESLEVHSKAIRSGSLLRSVSPPTTRWALPSEGSYLASEFRSAFGESSQG